MPRIASAAFRLLLFATTKYVYTIAFVEMEQAQLPRCSLSDLDFALVNGNFILSSGRKPLENPTFEYQNLLAVRTEDKDIEAYHSADFQKFIASKIAQIIMKLKMTCFLNKSTSSTILNFILLIA